MKLYQLNNLTKEELIIEYKNKVREINQLKKDMKKINHKWFRYYMHKAIKERLKDERE